MPVFDWTRTELAREREDGSTVLAYTQEAVDRLIPEKMFESIASDMNGTVMPGWEPERMAIAVLLAEMGAYVRGKGKEPYPLREALQDAYMAILLREAISTGDTLFSEWKPQ